MKKLPDYHVYFPPSCAWSNFLDVKVSFITSIISLKHNLVYDYNLGYNIREVIFFQRLVVWTQVSSAVLDNPWITKASEWDLTSRRIGKDLRRSLPRFPAQNKGWPWIQTSLFQALSGVILKTSKDVHSTTSLGNLLRCFIVAQLCTVFWRSSCKPDKLYPRDIKTRRCSKISQNVHKEVTTELLMEISPNDKEGIRRS